MRDMRLKDSTRSSMIGEMERGACQRALAELVEVCGADVRRAHEEVLLLFDERMVLREDEEIVLWREAVLIARSFFMSMKGRRR